MKKLLLLPFVAVLLLSSCSSKFGIAKRKYTKGYYFSVAKNNPGDKKDANKAALANKNNKAVEAIHTVQVAPALVLNTSTEIAIAKHSTPIQNLSKSSSALNPESQTVNAMKLTASASESKINAKSSIKPLLLDLKKIKNQMKSEKSAASDDRTILLVILSILLPPLAVYLHQDAINTKFWISVILTLLFWFPGVIYALLVVLGAI